MPKQKAPKGASSSSEITDARFANFTTDPRFRLPSKKHAKTKLDSRFSRMLTDDAFSNVSKVDRYGRKIDGANNKTALERLYVANEGSDEDEEDEDEDENPKLGGQQKKPSSKKEDVIEVEDDDVVEQELERAEGLRYDPARMGGFSSSSEDEDEEEEDEAEEDVEEFPDMQGDQREVEMGEVSTRFAVVNLDWDNIKATDLMAVFSSFVKPGGKIHKVSIYPSEFGKQRMEREELEGPPKEIFAKKDDEEDSEEADSEDDSDDERSNEKIKKNLVKEGEAQDFDGAALRQYQLERLRYYYAVVICSDKDTAQNIYESTDGSEYLSSANFFDLRFIPDGTEFDDKARDECESVPSGYRPIEFITDALQHSKVKLTWDTAPEEASRKDAIKRAFSGSRAEIGENDLRAYLGSDSESEDNDEEEQQETEAVETEVKLSKKDQARQKMRAALGLADEPLKSSKKSAGPVGDMEITFTGGLTSKGEKGSVFENAPIIEETTAEAYVRKERERKARRKAKAKAIREGRDPDAVEDDKAAEDVEGNEDLGFNDPFFAADEAVKAKASKSQRKEDRLAKREAKAAEAAAKASKRAELELLMQDNSTEVASHLDHFDIKEIARAEKQKKGKKGKKDVVEGGKRGGLQQTFEMDVGDERFSKLFESHEFAIDPSNPRFKGTEGMKALLEEGRKKRGIEDAEENTIAKDSKKRKAQATEGGTDDLSGLVEKLKKKSKK